MPESKVRRKTPFTPPPARSSAPKPNARWFTPLMLGLLVVGLLWAIVYYVTQGAYPIPHITIWNLLIGLGLMLGGFGMMTRWR